MEQNIPSLVEHAIIKRLEKRYTQKGSSNAWSIGYYFKQTGSFLLRNWLFTLIILGICYFLYIRYQAKQEKVLVSHPRGYPDTFNPGENIVDDIYNKEYSPTQHMELINELMDDYQKEEDKPDEFNIGNPQQFLAIEDKSTSIPKTCQPCQIMSSPEDLTPSGAPMEETHILAANESSVVSTNTNRSYLPPNNTNMYDTYSLSTEVIPANGNGKHASPFSGFTLLN